MIEYVTNSLDFEYAELLAILWPLKWIAERVKGRTNRQALFLCAIVNSKREVAFKIRDKG